VVGVDNFATRCTANLVELRREPRFTLVEQDICKPFDVGAIDFLFYFASPACPADYARLGPETLDVGSQGTKNALELARKYQAGFLHRSTSECYGDPEGHLQKETYWGRVNPIGPRSVYDDAKRFSEALIMATTATTVSIPTWSASSTLTGRAGSRPTGALSPTL
jgi:dTDP-glucose 4,6-dehydratase